MNMYLRVQTTSVLKGEVTPPSSKSESIRGLMFALLSAGESTLINPLDSDDMQDALRVCRALGADVSVEHDRLVMRSGGLCRSSRECTSSRAQRGISCQLEEIPRCARDDVHSRDDVLPQINTGNSGITTRFIMPILGLRQHTEQPILLDCGDQMRARPIHSLVEALRTLGLTIYYVDKEGMLPVTISGQLKGGVTEVDGITSQYISALLIALPCASIDSVVTVKNLHERPYMEMTLKWLQAQHIHYRHERLEDRDVYHIPGNQRYQPRQTVIAGDFSSASYLIAAAVMTPGRVELKGLDMQNPQGDKRLVPILQDMGAAIDITASGLIIEGGRVLQGVSIDANDIPDLLPTLAVIGTYAQGKTHIRNVSQARLKETDRIHSMTEGLTRLGAGIEEYADGMTVYQSLLQGAKVQGYHDHRTVMALAIAGMCAIGVTLIENSEAINKTFPTFISLMQTLGAKMEVTDEHTR
ncbi:MAG: 3-phosphoshikimate 1-carboxyvinyltransferase [Gammaproteobacteria bacterium]|nr:3-phosphoshikimate 1-carboxyvinyltransferase [Gammaproteobacteria bacterium]